MRGRRSLPSAMPIVYAWSVEFSANLLLFVNLQMSVAPSEGAIMAAPEGAKAPLVDASEGARRHGRQAVAVMRTNQPRSQGERNEKHGAAERYAAINS